MLKPTIAELILAASLHFEVTPQDIRGPSHKRDHARPRQIVMYMAYVLGLARMPTIARLLGDRHHTTVVYAVRVITQLIAVDKTISDAIANIHVLAMRMVRARDQKDDLQDVA